MKDLSAKLSKSGSLVVAPSAGTLATAKEFLVLNKQRGFIGWDIEGDCIDGTHPGLLFLLARHVLDEGSYITVDYIVQDAARVYFGAM